MFVPLIITCCLTKRQKYHFLSLSSGKGGDVNENKLRARVLVNILVKTYELVEPNEATKF